MNAGGIGKTYSAIRRRPMTIHEAARQAAIWHMAKAYGRAAKAWATWPHAMPPPEWYEYLDTARVFGPVATQGSQR